MTFSQVWFITGVSSGLGEELASFVLEQGAQVVATFRQPTQAADFTQRHAPNGLGVVVDVTRPEQIVAGVQQALTVFGRLDVVVNNAGYGSIGSIEEIADAEIRRQFEVNVFGPINLLKAVLPHLRAQKSGRIINISSVSGLVGSPAFGVYNGSKFALEGLGEALAAEVGPLGIHVTNVEPGPIRTKWAGASATMTPTRIADYEATTGAGMKWLASIEGNQAGDPRRGAAALYALAQLEKPPVHLPFGQYCYQLARQKCQTLAQEIEDFAYLGEPTDYQ
jgi:NAD(P)-dependent dehydrogenase (short-subunit alcohol dehydrogenase family)